MKTYKVVDIIKRDEVALFYGTMEECYDWKVEQGFGYRVLPLSAEEKYLVNSK